MTSPAPVILYGIANCDTIKKAKMWLDQAGIRYDFHDYRKQGIDKDRLRQWCEIFGYDSVLNRRGTTWRKLDEADKQDLTPEKIISLMQEYPSMIKRPVLEKGPVKILGFEQDRYKTLL